MRPRYHQAPGLRCSNPAVGLTHVFPHLAVTWPADQTRRRWWRCQYRTGPAAGPSRGQPVPSRSGRGAATRRAWSGPGRGGCGTLRPGSRPGEGSRSRRTSQRRLGVVNPSPGGREELAGLGLSGRAALPVTGRPPGPGDSTRGTR